MNIKILLNTLLQKQDLTIKESEFLLSEIIQGKVSAVLISALLTAFAMKRESVAEILGFIQIMRKHMVRVAAKDAIDVCGTGGDEKNTFNISTAVGFVVAG